MSTELRELSKLFTLYNALARQVSVSANKETSQGVAVSQRLIANLVGEINTAMHESHQLFAKLRHRIQSSDAVVVTVNRENEALASLANDFDDMQTTVASFTSTAQSAEKTTVALNHSIQEAFASLEDLSGEHYLVGSSVIALLRNKGDTLDKRDLDFVTSCKDEQKIVDKGFIHSIYQPWLYQKGSIDLQLTRATSPTDWLAEDAKNRDFTIRKVYVDKNRDLKDPSGTGVLDIALGRLRTDGDPVVWLQEDPIRALHAIRYMMDGFKPDPELADALKSFSLPEKFYPTFRDALTREHTHLCAVARKGLSRFDRKQYITLLKQYGLLEKLFGIPSKGNLSVALWKLEKLVGMDKSKMKVIQGLFGARTTDDLAPNPVAKPANRLGRII